MKTKTRRGQSSRGCYVSPYRSQPTVVPNRISK